MIGIFFDSGNLGDRRDVPSSSIATTNFSRAPTSFPESTFYRGVTPSD
jgi:hypothetical protein